MLLLQTRGINAANSRLSSGFGPNILTGDDVDFESGVGSWATGGTNTRAVSTDQAFEGSQSCKITFSNSNELLSQSVNLGSGGIWQFDGMVYRHAGWTDGLVRVDMENFTGSSVLINETVTTNGAWLMARRRIQTAADFTGSIRVESFSGNVGEIIYVDRMRVRKVL